MFSKKCVRVCVCVSRWVGKEKEGEMGVGRKTDGETNEWIDGYRANVAK